jgi:PAS domain S-box-containing protein
MDGQGVSELDLPSTLEAMDVGVCVFDRRGKPVFVNREARRIFGLANSEEAAVAFDGRARKTRVTTMQGAAVNPIAYVRRALAGESVREDFERVAPLDGKPQTVVRTCFSPVRSRAGEIIGAVKLAQDVTAMYDLDRRKSEFVRVTTHELRTPATVLRLNAQRLLVSTVPAPEQLRAAAEAIERATRRIEALSVKLTDIATVAMGERIALRRTEFRLDDLVADVARSVEPDQAGRVRTTMVPARVCADCARIREVVEALLDNALRYSDPPASVEVDVVVYNAHVELSVADHGIGIPAAKQPHMFEQFHRAHVDTPFDRGGLGASLYLAAQIIRQHGGRIWFESAERRGSTFHVALGTNR